MARIKPEFDPEMFYLLSRMTKALGDDAPEPRYPIKSLKVRTVQEIEESYNHVPSGKASCVIKMLERYIGPLNFRHGLRKYISKSLNGNANADDLGATLEQVIRVKM